MDVLREDKASLFIARKKMAFKKRDFSLFDYGEGEERGIQPPGVWRLQLFLLVYIWICLVLIF